MKKTAFHFAFFSILVWGAAFSDTLALEARDKQLITDLLLALKVSYAKVNDYSATMRLESFEDEYRLQNQKMWFKKPGYLRLEQLGPFKKGAVLVILPDGSIKGHLGGLLSFVVVSIDADDENMYGVTQDSALNSDYDRIIDIALGLRDRVISYSINTEFINNKTRLVLDTTYNGRITRMRLLIDPGTLFIVGLERYSKGKLIHKISWFDIQTNKGIRASRFAL